MWWSLFSSPSKGYEMEFSKIILELKNSFSLRKNHVLILEALEKENLTADEICSKTGIPKGRIYELLNFLLSSGLIEKGKGTPAYYSMMNPQENVRNFLKKKFDENVEKQTQVMALLEEKSEIEEIKAITGVEEFCFALMEALKRDNNFRIIMGKEASPYTFHTLHPKDDDDFIKVRKMLIENSDLRQSPVILSVNDSTVLQLNRYFNEAFSAQKSFEYIFLKEFYDLYVDLLCKTFGLDKVLWRRDRLEKQLAEFNIKMYVLDEQFPFYAFISEKEVITVLEHKTSFSGIKIRSQKAVNIFRDLFYDMIHRAKPIEYHQMQIEEKYKGK